MGNDGNIYGIPSNAERVLKIDPRTLEVCLIGPPLLPGVANKWYGGIRDAAGNIWGVPYGASGALKICPERGEVAQVGSFPVGGWKWHGGTRSGHYIVGIPSHAERVLRIDTRTDEVTEIGPAVAGKYKFGGACMDRDGVVRRGVTARWPPCVATVCGHRVWPPCVAAVSIAAGPPRMTAA